MSRRFVNLLPGQSARKEFVIEDAGDLVGKKIRVGLKRTPGFADPGTASPRPVSSGDPFSIAFSIVASGAKRAEVCHGFLQTVPLRDGHRVAGRALRGGPPPQPPGAPSPSAVGERIRCQVRGRCGRERWGIARPPHTGYCSCSMWACQFLRCASIATAWPAGPTAVQTPVANSSCRITSASADSGCAWWASAVPKRLHYLGNEMKAAGIAWCWGRAAAAGRPGDRVVHDADQRLG